ncbi:hypothetical protein [Streptomyces albiflavescens]|nr:hypothetical protein [Streptomyces albiflavescens]
MESTHTALRRVPTRARVGGPYAEPSNDHRSNPPIYAQLVSEWRAKGRVVPEHHTVREVLWASFAAPAPEVDEAEPVPAVPVPRGLPGWVRVTPR